MLIIGPLLQELIADAVAVTDENQSVLVSTSPLQRLPNAMPGCVMRVAASQVAAGTNWIRNLLAPALRDALGGDPWRRTF